MEELICLFLIHLLKKYVYLKKTILFLFLLPLHQTKISLPFFTWAFVLLWFLIIINSSKKRLLWCYSCSLKWAVTESMERQGEYGSLKRKKLMFTLQHSSYAEEKQRAEFEEVRGKTWRKSLPGQSLLSVRSPENSQQQQWKRSRFGPT